MKLFKSSQIRQIDRLTIENEPIASIDLMERAATGVYNEIVEQFDNNNRFCVIAGPGNNGGDGLVVARLLLNAGYPVDIFILQFIESISTDCGINLNRLKDLYLNSVYEIKAASELKIAENSIIIDAIFGSGLKRETEGEFAAVINKINKSGNIILSVDIPSGLFGEDNSVNQGAIVNACITYALEFPSVSMMFAENYQYFGDVKVVPIGLSPEAILKTSSGYFVVDNEYVQAHFRQRKPFEHKGDFGHMLLIAGSYGKAGAAVLAAKAAVRSGAGLVTAHLPAKLSDIMQISVPEAMISIDKHTEYCSGVDNLFKYNAIAMGPGYGTKNVSKQLLLQVLRMAKAPIVLDADALNILSEIPDFIDLLPAGTILTPHPKEFERLFGKFDTTYQKVEFMQKTAHERSIVIILKGGITTIAIPDGKVFFNTGGNPGMATGGSGDVLTGIIGSLLAQKYSVEDAALLGVWFHSNAGDLAEMHNSQMSLSASDITDYLGDVFSWYEN